MRFGVPASAKTICRRIMLGWKANSIARLQTQVGHKQTLLPGTMKKIGEMVIIRKRHRTAHFRSGDSWHFGPTGRSQDLG